MNPALITLCAVAQLAILYSQSRWVDGLVAGAGVVAIFAVFAYTRLRWDSHLDMFLAMMGPGGVGMLLGGMLSGDPSCHDMGGFSWTGFSLMSGGMLVASVPLCWFKARCLIEARQQGRGVVALVLDVVGMQAGMLLGHLPGLLVRLPDSAAAPWLHHAVMLVAMGLGMLAAAWLQISVSRFRELQTPGVG